MIADTTFLIHLVREEIDRVSGPARAFLARHRSEIIRTTIISIGEVAAGFESTADAWEVADLIFEPRGRGCGR